MFLLVDFGASYAGLATVGYTQKKSDGTTTVARTTSGVVDFSNGAYGVSVTPSTNTVVVKWDTGGGTPVYAHEEITAWPANIKQVNDVAVTGTGASGNEWGPA